MYKYGRVLGEITEGNNGLSLNKWLLDKKLARVNYYNISARHIGCYYLVDPKNKRINFMSSSEDSLYYHILDECYTEKFLSENKQEIIEIDGKKYNKQEVLDRMKELKEVK